MHFAVASLHFASEALEQKKQHRAASAPTSRILALAVGAARDSVIKVAEAPRLSMFFFNMYYQTIWPKNIAMGIFVCKNQYNMNFAFASMHFALEALEKEIGIEQRQRGPLEILLSPRRRGDSVIHVAEAPRLFQRMLHRQSFAGQFQIYNDTTSCHLF